MKSLFKIAFVFCLYAGAVNAQDTVVKLYNPLADGKAQIADAIKLADSTGKQVFVQVGGNWCSWCVKFNKFCNTETEIDSLLRNNYVAVHLNYSKENYNTDMLKTLGFPQRFGFPVIVILDSKGTRIHTQDTGLLESGDGYDKKKVIGFMKSWTKKSLDPRLYEKK